MYQKPIKNKTVNIGSVTIGSGGYVNLSQYKPVSAEKILYAVIRDWSTISPIGAIAFYGIGEGIMGAANTSITGLKVTYFYTD
jgi:hypothetical protein